MDEELTLVFAGDLAPQRPLSDERDGPREVWEYLRSADLVMVNLELPLTSADVPADKAITLRANPAIAPSVREAGVDAVTVANNHALDYGPRGLLETLEVLENAGASPRRAAGKRWRARCVPRCSPREDVRWPFSGSRVPSRPGTLLVPGARA